MVDSLFFFVGNGILIIPHSGGALGIPVGLQGRGEAWEGSNSISIGCGERRETECSLAPLSDQGACALFWHEISPQKLSSTHEWCKAVLCSLSLQGRGD